MLILPSWLLPLSWRIVFSEETTWKIYNMKNVAQWFSFNFFKTAKTVTVNSLFRYYEKNFEKIWLYSTWIYTPDIILTPKVVQRERNMSYRKLGRTTKRSNCLLHRLSSKLLQGPLCQVCALSRKTSAGSKRCANNSWMKVVQMNLVTLQRRISTYKFAWGRQIRS